MPSTSESNPPGKEGWGLMDSNFLSEGLDLVFEEPGLAVALAGVALVIFFVWTLIKGIGDVFGGPSQNLFG